MPFGREPSRPSIVLLLPLTLLFPLGVSAERIPKTSPGEERGALARPPGDTDVLAKLHCETSQHGCGRKEDKAQTLNQPVQVSLGRLLGRVGP